MWIFEKHLQQVVMGQFVPSKTSLKVLRERTNTQEEYRDVARYGITEYSYQFPRAPAYAVLLRLLSDPSRDADVKGFVFFW